MNKLKIMLAVHTVCMYCVYVHVQLVSVQVCDTSNTYCNHVYSIVHKRGVNMTKLSAYVL